jgi:hypothetical protein
MSRENDGKWKSLRGAITRRKAGERANLKPFEPISPYNRLRGAQMLIKRCDYASAVHILRAADRLGQRHPLFDYHLARSLWGLGRRTQAVTVAKRAARKWQLSFNLYLVSLFYRASDKNRLGEQWLQRAIKAGYKERQNKWLAVRIDPFSGKLVRKRRRTFSPRTKARVP